MGKKGAPEKKEDGEQHMDAETAKELAQYDNLAKITPFLDRHLVLQLLVAARESGIYNEKDVIRAELDVTFECTYPHEGEQQWVEETYAKLGEKVPKRWDERRERLVAEQEASHEKVYNILEQLENPQKVELISKGALKTREDLLREFEADADELEELPKYAKKLFNSGRYETAFTLVRLYMTMPQASTHFYVIQHVGGGEIVGSRFSCKDDAEEEFDRLRRAEARNSDQKKGESDGGKAFMITDTTFEELEYHGRSRERLPEMRAWWEKEQAKKQILDETEERQLIWGALASTITIAISDMGSTPQKAAADVASMIATLDEHLENSKAPKREVLLHRTWLLHWALFAIFRLDDMDSKVLDLFLSEKSLSIISLSCPHLFRYVGAALILHKRLKHIVKDTVWIIHHEAASYSDPITRFLLALYTEMDYDEAQRELQRCELVCKADYFLKPHWQEFQENARLHIFESYCRIHQCINIQMIAEKLNMQAEEAELWIVKLIQNAKLDARIDSEKSRVVMTKAPPNVYQQVVEKTKNLAFRSTMLVSNLEKN